MKHPLAQANSQSTQIKLERFSAWSNIIGEVKMTANGYNFTVQFGPLPCLYAPQNGDHIPGFTINLNVASDGNDGLAHLPMNFSRTADYYHRIGGIIGFQGGVVTENNHRFPV